MFFSHPPFPSFLPCSRSGEIQYGNLWYVCHVGLTVFDKMYKLDKFGRRIQRMEDDGTVNMRKEPTNNLSGAYHGEDEDVAPFRSPDLDGGTDRDVFQSPSLASFLDKKNSDRGNTNDTNAAVLAGGRSIDSVDLKELLPKQKMKFLKLDVSATLHIMQFPIVVFRLCRCMTI